MNEKIKSHVEALFENAPRTRRAIELKDELIANLNDRYNDMIANGKDEETAYAAVIAGIGDIDELIRGLREQEVFDPIQIQMHRQKSAVLVSIAVAVYIISFIFPIVFGTIFGEGTPIFVIGIVLMFICWAIGTMLLVYNAMSKPKYVKMEETIVEDFKEFSLNKSKKDAIHKSITSLAWMITVLVFLCLGFFADAWNPGWLVFILTPIILHIIKLVGMYRGEE